MILDEPTSQLDPVAARRIYDLIRQINEEFGVTIVIAEQRLEDFGEIGGSSPAPPGKPLCWLCREAFQKRPGTGK